MKKRVVITGIGPLCAAGKGKEQFWDNILAMKLVTEPVPEQFEKTCSLKSKFHVPLPKTDFSSLGFPSSIEKVMDPHSRMAVEAAHLALMDAGFTITKGSQFLSLENIQSCAIALGIGISNIECAYTALKAHLFGKEPQLAARFHASPRFPLMSAPGVMTNSPSAWISILYEINGETLSLNNACASGTCAIGEAFRKIRDGYHDVMIAGGSEYAYDYDGIIMRSFDILGTLTRSEDGNPRPFDKGRSGFLFSDGASCLLVLEEMEHAIRRGANIYAEIDDYAANSDAYNIVQIGKNGKMIKEMITQLSAGKTIDYINAHGTGTEQNDSVEASVFQQIFKDSENQPVINSTKGILGHTIAASGAFEAAVTALSIKHGKIHGNMLENPMDNLNLATQTRDHTIHHALSLSYGFGGHNGGLLLSAFKV